VQSEENLANLFLPAGHQFMNFILQAAVQPLVLLLQVVHLLLQPTLTMLTTTAIISYIAQS